MRKEDQKDLDKSTSRIFLRNYHSLSHYRPEENSGLVNQECQSVSRIGNTDNDNTKQKYSSLDQGICLMDRKRNRLNNPNKVSLDSSVGIVARLRAENPSNRSSTTDRSKIPVYNILLFKLSRPALRPTMPPFNTYSVLVRGTAVTTHHPLNPKKRFKSSLRPHLPYSCIACRRTILFFIATLWARGDVEVKALRYKPAGRGFDSRWCNWNFSVT
jgi:hypothetical protein